VTLSLYNRASLQSIILGTEIKNAGVDCFWKNLKSAPPKVSFTQSHVFFSLRTNAAPHFVFLIFQFLFVISTFLILGCIPCRMLQFGEGKFLIIT
jgi:hypothetical protein